MDAISKPPSGLPRGFREIWSDVSAAAAASGTPRSDLARALGVSTHTLQRILVDGRVPDFRVASVRQTRSWVRTLSRLAIHFDREPRRWIEAVGISWDGVASQIADEVAAAPRRPAVSELSDPVRRVSVRVEAGQTDPVEFGLTDLRPFSDPGEQGASFFETFAARLVGAVNPDWGLRSRRAAPADLVDALLSETHPIDLAAGLFESVPLRARGLDFLPFPGWRIAMGAVWLESRRMAEAGGVSVHSASGPPSSPPDWADLPALCRSGALRVLAQECDPAANFVRAEWGAPKDHVMLERRGAPEEFVTDLLAVADRFGDPVLFVGEEESCRRVREALAADDGVVARFIVGGVTGEEATRPRFPLGIAFRADAPQWGPLLRASWRDELFGTSSAETACQYGDLLYAATRLTIGRRFSPDPPSNHQPEPFSRADVAFRRAVSKRLLHRLQEGRDPQIQDDGESWDAVLRLAHAVIPTDWRSDLEEVAWESVQRTFQGRPIPTRPFETSCRSCATSLHEHGGASKDYCRFCSDDEGHLRPQEEVEQILAGWMNTWQGGLPEDQALNRARTYMSTMPAWSKN